MAGEVLWRDTGIAPKIFILDARAIFPLALWLFHWAYTARKGTDGGFCLLRCCICVTVQTMA